jgi:hypothetical protein
MPKNSPLDLTGRRFGKWVAVALSGTDPFGGRLWLCACDCGHERVIPRARLTTEQAVYCPSCEPVRGRPREDIGKRRSDMHETT